MYNCNNISYIFKNYCILQLFPKLYNFTIDIFLGE